MSLPASGLTVHLDTDVSVLSSDAAGTLPVTAAGSIVRHIAGVSGAGSAAGSPADEFAARIDDLTFPGDIALIFSGCERPFGTMTGLGGTPQSFTMAIHYALISPFGQTMIADVGGGRGAYETGGRTGMEFVSRQDHDNLTGPPGLAPGERRLIVRGDATAFYFKINGTDYTSVPGDTGAIFSGCIGDAWSGGFEMHAVLREYCFWTRKLSDVEATEVDDHFTARVAPIRAPAAMKLILADGNSLMVGYGGGSNASAWPNRMAAEIGTGVVRLINLGSVSYPTTSLTSQGATYVDPHMDVSRSRSVIMLQEGTNDILTGGASGATAWSNMQAWLTRLEGVWPASTRYVICTVPNIDTARSGYDASKQTAITACNTLIRANWASVGFDGIIDWADDALLDDATNATYTWGDGVHWTIAGQLKAAALAQAVVEPLLDTGSPLAAGSISITTPATSTTVGLTVTEATGGTGPYTRLWHRSTSSGFTPDGSNDLPGETSLTLADTGLTPSTTYYYKCVQTDDAAATVTTAQQSVTTEVGGGGGGAYLTLSSGGAYLILGGA